MSLDEPQYTLPGISRGLGKFGGPSIKETVRGALVGDDLVFDACFVKRLVKRLHVAERNTLIGAWSRSVPLPDMFLLIPA
jgi:hypothetical protein